MPSQKVVNGVLEATESRHIGLTRKASFFVENDVNLAKVR